MEGNEGYRVALPEKYVGKSFVSSLLELKNSYGAIIIGIERKGECLINPPSELLLEKGDFLLVLSEGIPPL